MAQELRGIEATTERYDLAEGVLFDDRAGLVRFVDIREGRVLSARLDGDRLVDTSEVRVRETVGAVALADDGGLLVAAARRLATISPDGDLSFGPDLLTDERPMRFNDGGVDPQGRFVVGTLSLSGPVGTETLMRISADGSVETLREGIQLSNGVGWSPDGATIYHVDTPTKTLSSHSYGPGGFDRDEPWVPVVTDFPAFPDGLRVDADGMLWVAQFSGSCVVRYAPDGREIGRVLVDAQQPTCVGFVGDRLVITSAIEHLSPEERLPADGALFLADVGVAGVPPHRWSGSTRPTKETS
ncbi:SMP-30/gluconolactonase/LRE family protein [Pseudolysinimonas sp.]|jgi:sugar lactone lactonase YvrE|uniref:SMP-30/gluconolactonase/LRE family protein n=1 Tax=Pseudolysinimonas sp. TaxID=2680009 RepID=UPI0037840497